MTLTELVGLESMTTVHKCIDRNDSAFNLYLT